MPLQGRFNFGRLTIPMVSGNANGYNGVAAPYRLVGKLVRLYFTFYGHNDFVVLPNGKRQPCAQDQGARARMGQGVLRTAGFQGHDEQTVS